MIKMYQKQNWETGQIITKEKLNHIEDGIASQKFWLIVNESIEEETGNSVLDKTTQEIFNAFPFVVLKQDKSENYNMNIIHIEYCSISQIQQNNDVKYKYRVDFGGNSFQAESLQDFPFQSNESH